MPGDSKTEKATPKKRKDERKKGNVFQSKDITTVVSIICIFYGIKLLFPFIYNTIRNLLLKYISYIKTVISLDVNNVMDILLECMTAFFSILAPIALIAMIVGIIGSGAQTKFIISFQSIKPKFSNLSPLKGIKKMFSLNSAVELIKSIIKVVIISYVLYSGFKGITKDITKLMAVSLNESILFIFDAIMNLVLKISLVFGVIALFDYLYQWWNYEKNMKMSKQELKEEYKHMEGDPQVKGKIKEKQRKISMSRMMQAVPTADVIIRNPTHFAIALKYDLEKDAAPMVVAKGQDYVALKIIEIAQVHQIPMTENKPLARALYATVEPNMPIPAEFYAVIAEIMAWVYTLKQKELKR
ncbi:flagellar biosynthesis protein FlhB [Paludicola sp. MB14-C6]|uniref:flagellar biosynthesis protein FlhB n=1 Tax=Paludihabitans sp. MB14-C6 TaxID=3070656 RepID=UPI0027DADF11|nr:flagellar biosynthesis protein FlhB [Paludicola sp. MB14-C6]WMJ24233.1 flagellar biosynthesis protein FlhB [Paludicola sp. MB14-C6]